MKFQRSKNPYFKGYVLDGDFMQDCYMLRITKTEQGWNLICFKRDTFAGFVYAILGSKKDCVDLAKRHFSK